MMTSAKSRLAGCIAVSARRDGFTLLELIAVMFILSLLAAVVLPYFHDISGGPLKTETGNMASLLRFLNESAISTKETCRITFDFSEGSVAWEGPDGRQAAKYKSLYSVFLASRGEVREGQLTLFFSSLGVSEDVSVVFREGENSKTVTLLQLSGRVKIMGSGDRE